MARLEHTALYAGDLEAVTGFFIKFFNATPTPLYNNPTTGFKSYFLRFEDGARLEVMSRPGLRARRGTIPCFGYHHLAFSVGDSAEVDRLTHLIAAAGYKVASGPRTTGDGYYESCIIGPEGNFIEITV